MAIAAGIPPPEVKLIDGHGDNAAAIGGGPDNATVIIAREILDDLDRDQTQGIIGHLIGSIGNGDLRVALNILAVYQTIGLGLTLLDTIALSRSARDALKRAVRFMLGSTSAAEAEEVALLLTSTIMDVRHDDIVSIASDPQLKAGPGIVPMMARIWVFWPLLAPSYAVGGVSLFLRMGLLFLISMVVSPVLALTWRTRRYLADASAVQLTRNPDAVATGLASMATRGGEIPGGQWASHLFVVENWRSGQGTAPKTSRFKGSLADTLLSWVKYHPPFPKRMQRLKKMGAHVREPAARGLWQMLSGFGPIGFILIPLWALLGVLMVVAAGLAIAVSTFIVLFFTLAAMLIVFALSSLLF
jgi:Zn-dependent protease with chaperone function